MNFSKLKLNEAALGDYSGMGTAAKASDGAMKSSQLQKSPARKNMQSNLSTSLMGNKKRDSNVNIQKTTEAVEQYFNELRQEVEEVKAYESQKSDWRTELSEAVVDGQEREDHPYVTVMPTGDENLIQAMKQMGKGVKEKKDQMQGQVKEGVELEEAKKKKKCKEGYHRNEDGDCVKDKKSRSTVIIGRGWGYGHGHDHDHDDSDNESDGGDAGGEGGGDGGGGMGEMFDVLGDMLLKEKLETGPEYHDRMKKNRKPINPFPVNKNKAADKQRKQADITQTDTRSDAQKMADATGPRKGSNFRGD